MPSAKRPAYGGRGRRSYKVSRATQSAEIIAHNNDIMLQILIRLPVKSLIRSKCVSKLWNSFISTPQFAQSYTVSKLNGPPSGLIVTQNKHRRQGGKYISLGDAAVSDKSLHSLKFFNAPEGSYLTILGTCNGLSLCQCGSESWIASRDPNVTYYVCNLATKQFKVLPPSSEKVEEPNQLLALSFDPFVSPHYKVVRVSSLLYQREYTADLDTRYEVEIYSSKMGCWGPIKQYITPVVVSRMGASSIVWKGWVFCGYSFQDHTFWYIDIGNECMKSIDLSRF